MTVTATPDDALLAALEKAVQEINDSNFREVCLAVRDEWFHGNHVQKVRPETRIKAGKLLLVLRPFLQKTIEILEQEQKEEEKAFKEKRVTGDGLVFAEWLKEQHFVEGSEALAIKRHLQECGWEFKETSEEISAKKEFITESVEVKSNYRSVLDELFQKIRPYLLYQS